jgi:hypothetical protein
MNNGERIGDEQWGEDSERSSNDLNEVLPHWLSTATEKIDEKP